MTDRLGHLFPKQTKASVFPIVMLRFSQACIRSANSLRPSEFILIALVSVSRKAVRMLTFFIEITRYLFTMLN